MNDPVAAWVGLVGDYAALEDFNIVMASGIGGATLMPLLLGDTGAYQRVERCHIVKAGQSKTMNIVQMPGEGVFFAQNEVRWGDNIPGSTFILGVTGLYGVVLGNMLLSEGTETPLTNLSTTVVDVGTVSQASVSSAVPLG